MSERSKECTNFANLPLEKTFFKNDFENFCDHQVTNMAFCGKAAKKVATLGHVDRVMIYPDECVKVVGWVGMFFS